MNRRIIYLTFLLFLFFQSSHSQWLKDYEMARKVALVNNKLILVDFWAPWCGPCVRMDEDVWSKPDVQELMLNFVPLKINTDNNRELSLRYNIKSIPNVFILDPNGMVLTNFKGYQDKNRMLKLLEKYMLNTRLIQDALVGYYKNPGGDTALQLAKRYLDIALRVDGDQKLYLINLSKKYRNKAKEHYRKSHQKNRGKQFQGLLDVYAVLIKGNTEKALKLLQDDFKPDEIEEANSELYDFLNFAAYLKQGDKEQAKIWYEKLKTHENYKELVARSRKLMQKPMP